MDYKSYKAMCDSTLQQIRKSENKREELGDKLQKMYQEKSECEKSIIKTLESQQKQFMVEKRRREERNENLLRSLERIDYQAHLLAAKTDRLRALKKQYERYLLSLWATRRIAVYPAGGNQLTGTFAKPFTAKYDESPIHQSSHYNTTRPAFATDLRAPNYLQAYPNGNSNTFVSNSNHITATSTPHHNQSQSHFSRELPLTSSPGEAPDSIKTNNYLMTTTTGASGDMDPRFSFPPSYPLGASPIMMTTAMGYQGMASRGFYPDNNTINIIGDMNLPQTINSIYTPPRQCSDLPSSPVGATSQHIPTSGCYPIYQYNSNQQPLESRTNNQNNNNNDYKMSKSPLGDNINPLIMPATAAAAAAVVEIPSQRHPLSADENRLKRELRFDDAAADDDDAVRMDVSERRRRSSQLEIPVLKASESAFGEVQMRRKSIERGEIMSTQSSVESVESARDSSPDRGMHQVWEKVVIAEPSSDVHHTSFVIPKIIVETQLDMAEATATTITAFSPDEIATVATTNVDADTPEKPLNQKMEKHSRDNGASTMATTKDNNSPVMDVESSIYHYGKQQQQQQQQEQQHVSELQKFSNMKISGEDEMTHGIENDNEKRHTLNDKIGEIYRKIERIEGEYYDEKEKIIENFEKRVSLSPKHEPIIQKEVDLQEGNLSEAQVEFNYETPSPDKQQTFNDDVVEEPAGIQPMFDSNQYASSTSKVSLENDEGELQANFVEHPSSTEEMQYQQQQDYYASATGYEQQQQQQVEYDYSQYQQQPDYSQQQFQSYQAPLDPTVSTPLEQFDPNYQQNSNYEPTAAVENLTNYNETSAVYYDPTLTVDANQVVYDDQNYSNQQPMMTYQSNEEGDSSQMSEYFYQQEQQQQQQPLPYENNNNDVYLQEHSDESNYYGSGDRQEELQQQQPGELIETSNDDTYDNNNNSNITSEYLESQAVPLNSTNYDDLQSTSDDNRYENFENQQANNDDATSSSESKPSVDMEIVSGGDVIASTKQEDVKLVKQLLDSESDDATTHSNLLSTAIREEEKEDESDFDFSAN